MHLQSLRLIQFRNFESVSISPSPSLNIIYGQNGAGKSSILEAIHLLGYGRSFRTSKANSVIQFEADESVIFTEVKDGLTSTIKKIGCSRHRKNGYTFKINDDASTKLSDLVRHVPVQIFTPQSSDLILGAPVNRRKFIDWALFHVEHSFSGIAQKFSRITVQRNAALRNVKLNKSRKEDVEALRYWDDSFATEGYRLHLLRKSYCDVLNAKIQTICKEFMPEFTIDLGYNAGWDIEKSLAEELVRKFDRDVLMGHSTIGPQKADIKIKTNGLVAAEVLSRGQLRILVSVLQLSQMMLFSESKKQSLIYLIDDIAAELDLTARKKFLSLLLSTNTQVFVTAIEKSQFDFMNDYNDKKVFHVEHNQVNEE